MQVGYYQATGERKDQAVNRRAFLLSASAYGELTLAAAIQEQKLVPDQHGFGNHTAETPGLAS